MKLNSILRSLTAMFATMGLFTVASAAPSQADTNDLLTSYYAVQQAFAGDDLATARSAASALSEKAGQADAPDSLQDAAKAVANAANIKAARADFQTLSNHMQALVESVGAAEPAYVVRCPMAFGGKGGTWLQKDKSIANPYFGSSMPRCGSVIKELNGAESMAKPAHMHGTH